MENEETFTIEEARAILGVDKRTMRRIIADGDIVPVKRVMPGRAKPETRITRGSITDFVGRLPQTR
jgi:predicted transcriptional regulator of viral defense system